MKPAYVWPAYSPTLLGSIFYGGGSSDQEQNLPGSSMYQARRLDAVNAVVNILFPIIGVIALKSMKQTKNIRETIELTVPVCGLNSLCIVCIILMQHSMCLSKHLSSAIRMEGQKFGDVYNQSDPATGSGAQDNIEGGEYDKATIRYQPIIAALVLPFPLVCSIVCIVAAGRNHRIMVRSHTHTHTLSLSLSLSMAGQPAYLTSRRPGSHLRNFTGY
jgi:hypothetical protein